MREVRRCEFFVLAPRAPDVVLPESTEAEWLGRIRSSLYVTMSRHCGVRGLR